MFAQLDEFICFAVRHRFIGDSLERLRTVADLVEEFVWATCGEFALDVAHEEVETIEVFPHLAADLFTHAARIFPGKRDAGRHRIWILRMPEQELTNIAIVTLSEMTTEEILIAGYSDDWSPRLSVFSLGVKQGVKVDRENARDVLGTFHVP